MKTTIKTTTGETTIDWSEVCAVTVCRVWSTEYEMMLEEYHVHLKSGTIFVTKDAKIKSVGWWAQMNTFQMEIETKLINDIDLPPLIVKMDENDYPKILINTS